MEYANEAINNKIKEKKCKTLYIRYSIYCMVFSLSFFFSFAQVCELTGEYNSA